MARRTPFRRRKVTPKPDEGTREEYLVAALRQLEDQVEAAEDDQSWNAAVNAKAKALQVRAELDQLRETQVRTVAPRNVEDHKAEVLSEVRRLRIGATEAGSYVAAATLLRLEREMLTATQAELTEAEAKALTEKTLAELEAEAEALRARRAAH